MTDLPHLIPVVPGLDIFEGESEGRFPRSHSFLIRSGHPYAEKALRYWEGQMIRKHLERLERNGRAIRDGYTTDDGPAPEPRWSATRAS